MKYNVMIIIRPINYVILKRDTKMDTYVACYGFNFSKCEWDQGHYFQTYSEAYNYVASTYIERLNPSIKDFINSIEVVDITYRTR